MMVDQHVLTYLESNGDVTTTRLYEANINGLSPFLEDL